MMERLTTEFEGFSVPKEFIEVDEYDITAECKDCWEICEKANNDCKTCAIQHCFNKLAAYEDAEEKGLLHRTPIAIGQTVYTNFAMSGWYLRNKDKPYKAKVVFIGLNLTQEEGGGFFNIAYEKLGCMMQFRFSDIGKGVFLTKEEAEAALQKMQEGA